MPDFPPRQKRRRSTGRGRPQSWVPSARQQRGRLRMGPLVRHRRRLGWLAAWWDKARPSSAARSRVPILVAVFSFAIAFYVIGQSAPEIVVNRGGLRRTWLLLALPAVG